MTGLQVWLKIATRGLSREAADQVRREIEDHYQSAREVALDRGATLAEADHQALAALGEAEAANDQYHSVLLTKAEAKMLRGAKRDDQFFRCRPGLGRVFRAGPVLLLCTAVASYKMGADNFARIMLAATLGIGMIFTVPTFPIYTPARSQLYRYSKWPIVFGAVWLADGLRPFGWLGSALIWLALFGSTEWVCASLRKKLPISRWPKMLYL